MYIDDYISTIKSLCKEHNVKGLYVFGSVTSEDKFNESSDIDFLVELKDEDPLIYAENYFSLKFKLEDLLNRKIDMLEQKSLVNKYLKNSIDKTKRIVYAS